MSPVLPVPLQQALQKARIISAFHALTAADDLIPTVTAFTALEAECSLAGDAGSVPDVLRGVDHFAVKRLIGVLDAKLRHYDSKPLVGRRVLIIGAGPGGLRCAIEALVLGAEVQVVEKRRQFSRHNVLVLWTSVVDELHSLGLKELFKKFGSSSDKLCIRRMQLLLLKLALLLGAKLHLGLEFVSVAKPLDGAGWRAMICADSSTAEGASHPPLEIECSHLVGADGEHSVVRESIGFSGTEVS